MSVTVDFSKITDVVFNNVAMSKLVRNGVTYWEKTVAYVPTQVWVTSGYYKTERYIQSSGTFNFDNCPDSNPSILNSNKISIYNSFGGAYILNGSYFSFTLGDYFYWTRANYEMAGNKYCGYYEGSVFVWVGHYDYYQNRQVWVDTSHYETQNILQTVYNYIK